MITNTDKLIGLQFLNRDTMETYQDAIISGKEDELLRDWFGYALAKDLRSGTPSAEAQKLIDGFEYTDSSGDLQKIDGLADLLVYFMYFYIARDTQTVTTSVGEQEALAENSTTADSTPKLVQNYNRGVYLLNNMLEYLNDEGADDYPTYIFSGYQEMINRLGI